MLKSRNTVYGKKANVFDTIDAIKANNTDVIKQIYIENYPKVELLVLKNSGTKEQAKDLYQEAFLAFWRNISGDKFIPKSHSSINGYLYTIAKYKWIDQLRSIKDKKTVLPDDRLQFANDAIDKNPVDHDFTDDIIEKERLLDKAMAAFKNLGQPCKSLLIRFYFEKKSMKEIAKEFQLDPASARNKKYRCMQKLRDIALKAE